MATIQTTPNMRFGTTFLDIKNEAAAVNHEVMMDKITGELNIKRPIDGKVISFSQQNKYLFDTLLEFKTLLNNNPSFEYRQSLDFFSSVDYTVRYLRNESNYDVLSGNPMTFNTTSTDSAEKLEFVISSATNGFFILLNPRVTDRAAIDILSDVTDYGVIEHYTGTNPVVAEAASKYAIPGWKGSNAVIDYTINVVGSYNSNNRTIDVPGSACVRIGKHSLVLIPTSFRTLFTSISTVKVTINSISFEKLIFAEMYVTNTIPDYGVRFSGRDVYEQILAPDKKIDIQSINIFSTPASLQQLIISKNREHLALLHGIELQRCLTALDNLTVSKGSILSPTTPDIGVWNNNNMWCESINYIGQSGTITNIDHTTDLTELTKYMYAVSGIETGFTLDELESDMILVDTDE